MCAVWAILCSSALFYFIPTVWNQRFLLSIMCFGFVIDPCVSLRTAGKLPGCSVWALCPCLDLHAVKFSGFKHPCDAALFLASLAHLQETRTVFEGGKTQSWIILLKSTQEREELIHPTQCLQRRLYRMEQIHIQINLFPQKNPNKSPPKCNKTKQQQKLRVNYIKIYCNEASTEHNFLYSSVRWDSQHYRCAGA